MQKETNTLSTKDFFSEELDNQFVGKGAVNDKLWVSPGTSETWNREMASNCSHGSHSSHSSK